MKFYINNEKELNKYEYEIKWRTSHGVICEMFFETKKQAKKQFEKFKKDNIFMKNVIAMAICKI